MAPRDHPTPPAPEAVKDGTSPHSTPVLKKWLRLFRAWRHHAAAARLKREILRLEKARSREKTALQRQRRFYERLFRRSVEAIRPTVPAKPFEKPAVPTPAPALHVPQAPPFAPTTTAPTSTPIVAPAHPANATKPAMEKSPLIAPSFESYADQSEKDQRARSAAVQEQAAVVVPPAPAKPAASPAVVPLPKAPVSQRPSIFRRWSRTSLAKKLAKEREEEKAWQERNEVEKRFWQPYAGVKPNLIKNQATVFFNWHEHFLVLGLSIIISCLAISLVYVSLLVWQKERLQNNQAVVLNTRVLEAEIAKNENDIKEVIAFNNKLGLVASLLDNHAYWTELFAFLENNTLKDVYYESFKGDLSGSYAIPAVSRSLDAVSLQLEVLKANATVKEATYDLKPSGDKKDRVLFNLGLSLDPTIFLK